MTKITDPVAIAEELLKWEGKEVTAYISMNPYVEFGLKSVLSRMQNNSWRVQLGVVGAATAVLFTVRGVAYILLQEGRGPHISINLSPLTSSEPAGEFT